MARLWGAGVQARPALPGRALSTIITKKRGFLFQKHILHVIETLHYLTHILFLYLKGKWGRRVCESWECVTGAECWDPALCPCPELPDKIPIWWTTSLCQFKAMKGLSQWTKLNRWGILHHLNFRSNVRLSVLQHANFVLFNALHSTREQGMLWPHPGFKWRFFVLVVSLVQFLALVSV